MNTQEPQDNHSKTSVEQEMHSFRLSGDHCFKFWHWLVLLCGILIMWTISLLYHKNGSSCNDSSTGASATSDTTSTPESSQINPPKPIEDPREPSIEEIKRKQRLNEQRDLAEGLLHSMRNNINATYRRYQHDIEVRLADFLEQLPPSEIYEVFKASPNNITVITLSDGKSCNFEKTFPQAYKIVCGKTKGSTKIHEATEPDPPERIVHRLQNDIMTCKLDLAKLEESIHRMEQSFASDMNSGRQIFQNSIESLNLLDSTKCNAIISEINDLATKIQKDSEEKSKAAIAIAKNIQKNLKEYLLFRLETEKLTADVNVKLNRYLRNLDAIFDDFLQKLPPQKAQEAFQAAHDGVTFIASREGLCGWKTSAVLTYKMAYDKVKGTNRTEEAVAPILNEHIIIHIQEAVQAYESCFGDLLPSVKLEERAFTTDLMLRCANFQEVIEPLETLDSEKLKAINFGIANFSQGITELATEKSMTAIGIAVEAMLAKATFNTMKTVVMRLLVPALAKATARATGTLTAAGVSSIIDGPLPIGDIIGGAITIGGTVWLATDIYKVTKTLPHELRTTMNGHIAELEEGLKRTAEENVKTLHTTLKNDATGQVNALLLEMNPEQ